MNRPRTKILVDGGDPQETLQVKKLLGFVDGQTTNPSLIANNPEIKELLAAGRKLSEAEELAEYKKIVGEISPLVGDCWSLHRSVLRSQFKGAGNACSGPRNVHVDSECLHQVPVHC